MPVTIENEFLRVTISELGAEIKSVQDQSSGQEYIWPGDHRPGDHRPGDESQWTRSAPVLFPIVGRLRNDCYVFEGRWYSMDIHGFAKDSLFKTRVQKSSAIFELSHNPATLAQYPFEFALTIHIALAGRSVTVSMEVRNPSSVTLPFSIGAHPGFICPHGMEDQELVFSCPETASTLLTQNGLFTGRAAPLLHNEQVLRLHSESFRNGALVFQGLHSERISLRSKTSGSTVSVGFADFAYLGIWSKPGAPFVCLEPWHGKADSTASTGDFSAKPDLIHLAPGKTFQSPFDMTFD